MRILPFLVLAILALAGCIQPATQPGATRGDTSRSDVPPSMTAQETHNDSTAPCLMGISVNGASVPGAFCATRTVTLSGTIAGIASLPVNLATFDGPIDVREGNDGQWALVATLVARGTTPDDATSHLSDMWFTWSDGSEGAREIRALAKTNESRNDGGYAASLPLTLPHAIVMRLNAADGSGSITVQGGQTDGLTLSTGSGNLKAQTMATRASLRSGSGTVEATLTPTASGDIAASTGSGSVTLRVPEDAQHGYALTASTGSGTITIGLKDGATSPCPQYGPCNHRSFTTSGFGGRAMRTTLVVSSGSGDIAVQPA